MSLQSRLFLFFTIIVLVPLAVGGVLAQRAVSGLLAERDRNRVALASPGALSLYGERVGAMPDRVLALAGDAGVRTALAGKDAAGLTAALRRAMAEPGAVPLAFAVVADPRGAVVAQVLGQPDYLAGVDAPGAAEMLSASSAPGSPRRSPLLLNRTLVPVVSEDGSATIGTLAAGDYLDNRFARSLARATGVDVTLVIGGQAVATSLPAPPGGTRPWAVPVGAAGQGPVRSVIGGRTVDAVFSPLVGTLPPSAAALVTSTPLTSRASSQALVASIVAVLVAAAIGAALLGFATARAVTRPLRELAEGANAIAAGRYDQYIEVRSTDEVGQLARAFNEMARRLSVHVTELEQSREGLRRSLTRFGETLRSTHDLGRILQVVLDTSIDAVGARGGLLMVLDEEGRELTVAAARGVEAAGLTLSVGEGVAGSVARTGEPLLLPHGPDDAGGVGMGYRPMVPDPSPAEPLFRTAIWVPVFVRGRIFAVACLLDRDGGERFAAGDLETVLALADQAGVAIDNVVLHQDAQRLAITDGLTGIWNHRYFQLRFEQEMDRSTRFRRPFCIALCDVDDFKVVNDTHGHLVGDGVLVDLARRVKAETRDIDVLARYGGEEFVLILPETDAEGGFRAAEKIRRKVAEAPLGRDHPVPVTVSIGVAAFPLAGVDRESLVRAADAALYQAKALGKNRTIVFQPSEEGKAS